MDGDLYAPGGRPEKRLLYAAELRRDFRRETSVSTFSASSGEDMERSNGASRYYDCEHVLATLLSDVLFQYHQCGGSGVKTADVLNYILARQTRQNWKLGACDFKRYFEYNWENSTLLAALFAVPECFDSEYLWSWDTTVYPWTLSLTVPTEALKSEIRYAKNMTNIKKTTDATSIANRVYALGYGEV